jgi:hypothetical protein
MEWRYTTFHAITIRNQITVGNIVSAMKMPDGFTKNVPVL